MLKAISKESIPHSLDKAERYRLLNEPFFAESICLDVLAIEPDDQRALVVYILALTDQFANALDKAPKARAAIQKLTSEHDKLYYAGIVSERSATAILDRGGYGANGSAWHHIHDAMVCYEKADAVQQDSTNDDAVLRYNTCVRLIEAHRLTEPSQERDDYPLE